MYFKTCSAILHTSGGRSSALTDSRKYFFRGIAVNNQLQCSVFSSLRFPLEFVSFRLL
jgi:hypothetical protein